MTSQTRTSPTANPTIISTRSVPKCRHIRNVPKRQNDWPGNADVLAKSAKTHQSEQGGVKEEGIGLVAMPDD